MLGKKIKLQDITSLFPPLFFFFYCFVDVSPALFFLFSFFFSQNRDNNTYLIPEGHRFRLHIPAVTTIGG